LCRWRRALSAKVEGRIVATKKAQKALKAKNNKDANKPKAAHKGTMK
jgi:hypothetical protein